MRICDVNNFYSPTGGGIRIYHHRKLEYFRSSSRDTISLVVPSVDYGKRESDGEIRYTLGALPLGSSGYRLILDSGGLSSVFSDFQPEIIETGTPYLLPDLVNTALAGRDVPVTGFFHSNYPESYVAPFARKYLPAPMADGLVRMAWRHAGRIYGRMAGVFAASRCMLRKLAGVGVKRLFYTPLGVDTHLFSPSRRSPRIRRELGVSGSGKLVLYLARIQGEKGIDLLMRSYPMFRDPGSTVLVIGGTGPAESRVRRFLRKYPEVARLPRIHSREDVAALMASSDVFLSLGTQETFGLAGLEAISSGALPVLPGSGSAGEIADALGLLPSFQPGDASDLADVIRLAVEKSGTFTGELRCFAEDGYSWDSVFRRIRGFYQSIISACESGRTDELEHPDGWWES